jgi:hypothetical protein
MRGSCSTHGMMRITYRILVREPEGKRPLIRRRHGWEDNIRMDVKDIGWKGVNWIHPAQNVHQWRTSKGLCPMEVGS